MQVLKFRARRGVLVTDKGGEATGIVVTSGGLNDVLPGIGKYLVVHKLHAPIGAHKINQRLKNAAARLLIAHGANGGRKLVLVKGRFAIRHRLQRAHKEGVIGHGIEIHGPVKLHGEAAGMVEYAPLSKVVGVVRARQGAHGEGIKGVGGMNMKIAVERLPGRRMARA